MSGQRADASGSLWNETGTTQERHGNDTGKIQSARRRRCSGVSYIRLHAYRQAFVETVSYTHQHSSARQFSVPPSRGGALLHAQILHRHRRPSLLFSDVGHMRTACRSRVGQLCFVEEGRTTGAAIRDERNATPRKAVQLAGGRP